MKSRSFLLILSIVVASFGNAQQALTSDHLELLNKLHVAANDTNKVILLLEMADFHWSWKNGRNKDSIISYGNKAYELSKVLNSIDGVAEACFRLCRMYAFLKDIKQAEYQLARVTKEHQPRLLWVLGEHYLFRPGEHKINLDSAIQYFDRGMAIAREVGSRHWINEMLIAKGKYYFSAGDFNKGKGSFLELIGYFHQQKDSSGEAHIWSELGIYMPDTDSTYTDALWAHQNSIKLYHSLKDTANERTEIEEVATINLNHAKFDLAKSQYLQALELRRLSNNKKFYIGYVGLAWAYHATGDLNIALSYALAAEKNIKELDIYDVRTASAQIGQIYSDNGEYEKSLEYFLPLANANSLGNYYVCRKIVEQYINLHQPKKALAFVLDFEKKSPPVRVVDEETLAAVKGDCYSALGNYAMAEKNYLSMIAIDKKAQEHKGREIFAMTFPVTGAEAYYRIANFYVQRNMFSTASPYVDKALQTNSFSASNFYTSGLIRNLRWLRFKTDSAMGNYISAIRNYREYTRLNDSIFNVAKSKQLQQLSVQYETDKKETDIKARDQRIQVLVQNDTLRQANLRQARTTQTITIIATIIFFLLAALLYRQYKQKLKANRLITNKNGQLQHFLDEKEWLLKEIHHRVKNNLQIVMSLLNSQSAFIDNETALAAIHDSKHRVHAMSLIHQKLYGTANVSSIDMSIYIRELSTYLADSFGTRQRIRFEYDIEPIILDVSQAVPLGLILNEAITNSIKYAFPGNNDGIISISLSDTGNEHYQLQISDNGIGILPRISNKKPGSLGMSLIEGLTEDLEGNFLIENNNGTTIKISFPHDHDVKRSDQSLTESFVLTN